MGSSTRTPASGLTDVVLRQATVADLPEVADKAQRKGELVCAGSWPRQFPSVKGA